MHLLQSPYWQSFKSQFGWYSQSINLNSISTSVYILFKRLPLGFNIAYIPKGPTINWKNEYLVAHVLNELKNKSHLKKTIFLKIEPDVINDSTLNKQFYKMGYIKAKTVQPVNTIIINTALSEDDVMATMKSKTRYNIRLATKKGVEVKVGTIDDLAIFHQLSQVTAQRDGFGIHPLLYYQTAFQHFPLENRILLLAYYQNQPLAGLIAFAYNQQAYYLYGASNNHHRNKMPTYLLQWEAIKWAKANNCHSYDLWGIPDAPLEQLESDFTKRSDGLWGVYRFKRGFGGQVVRWLGAFDYIYNRPLYMILTKLIEKRANL